MRDLQVQLATTLLLCPIIVPHVILWVPRPTVVTQLPLFRHDDSLAPRSTEEHECPSLSFTA
jgi:hypothetical protein